MPRRAEAASIPPLHSTPASDFSQLAFHRGWEPIRAADLGRLDAEAMLQAVTTDGWDIAISHRVTSAPACAHGHFGYGGEGQDLDVRGKVRMRQSAGCNPVQAGCPTR